MIGARPDPDFCVSSRSSAAYIGVSPTLFDEMVKDGRMPQPVRINSRVLWDRLQLDDAFAALSDMQTDGDDPWARSLSDVPRCRGDYNQL